MFCFLFACLFVCFFLGRGGVGGGSRVPTAVVPEAVVKVVDEDKWPLGARIFAQAAGDGACMKDAAHCRSRNQQPGDGIRRNPRRAFSSIVWL